ncbi:MAG: histidine phosphatase family protein [Pseudomonadota bacterium]
MKTIFLTEYGRRRAALKDGGLKRRGDAAEDDVLQDVRRGLHSPPIMRRPHLWELSDMSAIIRYLTHPQVHVDPDTPVPDWRLSVEGVERVEAAAALPAFQGTVAIISSAERKARETAAPLAAALGLDVTVRAAMHENDRSATGFLPPPEFEATADAFFARPQDSVRGWERAADAQARIVREAEAALTEASDGDVLFVGHGAVGTLLYCAWAGLAIDRRHDQTGGGGQVWAASRAEKTPLYAWRMLEDEAG